jgi:SAM-dependent methyltransferase
MGEIRETFPVFSQLGTAAGRAELDGAIALVQSMTHTDPVRRAAEARARLPAELATAALAQADLRAKGRGKFGADADRMYFTRDGLEQATRLEVADHRARRYKRAGIASVLDLCCGIGSDVLAFSRAGLAVTAIDHDPDTATVAAANVAVTATSMAGISTAQIEIASAELADWRAAESVFIDPARRTTAGRTFNPSAYSPSFGFVTEVLTGARFAAAKLGPGLDHAVIPDGVEAEWVSWKGAVKEAVLWSAGFAGSGVTRRATVLPGAQLTDADASNAAIGPIGAYLYEPDGAVIRAGLVQQMAALLPGGRRIDSHLAYLAADGEFDSELARGFRVIHVLPYSVKRLRAELARREVGIVEIKKRGVDVDPAQLRTQLAPRGPHSISVLLARVGERRLAILAEPVKQPRLASDD